MEENQNYKEETVKVKEELRPMCANHPIMKTLFIGLLIFLGAFCAFYVVADWHFKRVFGPQFINPEKMERLIQKDMRSMDKMMFKESKDFSRKSANVIHLEQAKNFYKVIIDLRAFDNNENNVQVTTNGNILTINGRSIRKSKNNEQISEFQQHYMFGNNVRLADLTKETNGNYYIITIPIGENKNENENDNDD